MLELHLAPGSFFTVSLLLTAAWTLSCGLLAKSVIVMLLVPRLAGLKTVAIPLEQLGKLLAVALAAFQLFIWQLYFYRGSHDTVDAMWVAVGLGLCFLLAQGLEFFLRRSSIQVARASFLAVTVLQVIGFGMANHLFSKTEFVAVPLANVPGELKVNENKFASTDRGTRIALFDRELEPIEFSSFVHSTRADMLALTERAILRSGPVANTNCHGWVFAGGLHIVKGVDVQTILNDNSYQEITQPAVHDLVVYRDPEGDIVHTGILCGFIDGGIPLVESKWGIEGTYLHLAADQPYSQQFSFYRTPRPSHTLRIYTGPSQMKFVAGQQVATLPQPSDTNRAKL